MRGGPGGPADWQGGEAYLPLVRFAQDQNKVVAATADIRVTSRGLLPAAVRVVPDRSGPGGPRSSRDAGTDLSGPAYLGHSIVRRLPERVLGSFWRASAVWCGWH